LASGRHIRPEDEYAQTYYKWRRSVAQNRAQGRSRTRPEAYYEQAYGNWREAVRERKRRTRRSDDGFYASLPLRTRLKQRYARRRWLLFSDGFGVLASLTVLMVLGVRVGAQLEWGKVPHSMIEAFGTEQQREIARQAAEDEADLARRNIRRLRALPPGSPAAAEDDTEQQELARLRTLPPDPGPQAAPPALKFTPAGQ
jgi:hypothetical protein